MFRVQVSPANKAQPLWESPTWYVKLTPTLPSTITRNAEIDLRYADQAKTNPAVSYLIGLGSKDSRRTMKTLLTHIAHIVGATSIMSCAWSEMDRSAIKAIIATLVDRGLAPATVNTYLAAIKGVAREAWGMRYISVDDYQQIMDISRVRGSRLPNGRILPQDELRKLYKICEADKRAAGVRDAAMIALLFSCGLRRAELVSIDLSDVSFNEESILIRGKGNKERLVYPTKSAFIRMIKWINDVRGELPGPLFTRIRRHSTFTLDRLTSQAVYYIADERSKEACIEHFSPHDLRYSFVSTLFDSGVDAISIRDAAGHSSITTTQRYDKRNADRIKTLRVFLEED